VLPGSVADAGRRSGPRPPGSTGARSEPRAASWPPRSPLQ